MPVALVGSGCSDDDAEETTGGSTTTPPTVVSTAAPTTVAGTTAPSTTGPGSQTTTTAARRLGPDSRLRVDGVGPVRVGMTVDEARRVAGIPVQAIDGPYCRGFRSTGGFSVEVLADSSERINLVLVPDRPIATQSGISVGSSRADVLAAYPGQVEVRPGAPGPHWIVFRPRDPALAANSLVFEIDEGGKVRGMKAGVRERAEADENCA